MHFAYSLLLSLLHGSILAFDLTSLRPSPTLCPAEPVDGFHPSQTGQQLLADIIWTDLQTNRPQWLPSTNPFNSDIVTLFGDQGGY